MSGKAGFSNPAKRIGLASQAGSVIPPYNLSAARVIATAQPLPEPMP